MPESVITWDDLNNGMSDVIHELHNRDCLYKYLDILANNPAFEMKEAICLYFQFPLAKLINTYTQWKHDYGRHIKPNEKGIKIPEEDGKITTVFDVSQTQGKAVVTEKKIIRNSVCVKKFIKIADEVVMEQMKKRKLPLNCLSGTVVRYVLLKHHGIEYPEFLCHMSKYAYSSNDAVRMFLGQLHDILHSAYAALNEGYFEKIRQFVNTLPEREQISEHKLTAANGRESAGTGKQVTSYEKGMYINKRLSSGKKASILKKLEEMKKLAAILNERRSQDGRNGPF